MPITPIYCSKMIIYKIQHNEKPELLYIGSTTNFKMRKSTHKSTCNNENSKGYNILVYKMIRDNDGWDAFSMIQIKEFPCNNIRESEAEEYRLMHELKASLNICRYTGENRKEYIQEYRKINKEHLNEQSKEYREANKEHIKLYRDNNKEDIQKLKNIKFDCICGGKYTYSHKSRHFKGIKHLKYIAENPDVLPSL